MDTLIVSAKTQAVIDRKVLLLPGDSIWLSLPGNSIWLLQTSSRRG